MGKHPLIRTIYLYTFSLIGLILIIFASVSMINIGLKTFIFTDADQDYYPRFVPLEGEESKVDPEAEENFRRSQRQRELSQSIASLLVGIPLYLFHWNMIKRENQGKTKV
jgi:hypothetical protein